MISPWHVSVLIPARNEEQLLPRCLRSVLAAFECLPCHVSYDLTVAVDSSTDSTLEIAERIISKGNCGAVVSTNEGLVGWARSLATDTALRRHTAIHHRWWLANTDADCEVPKEWLTRQLTLADSGVDAIAGVVDVDSFEEHGQHVPDHFRSSYLIRPDGSHPHIHGANIGFRADAYLRAGGWRSIVTAEDHDLWNRLGTVCSNRLSTDQVRVITSGRRIGRAPCGFANALAAHNESAA